MYTPEQQQFMNFVREKTRAFCDAHPVPVHGFDHAERVTAYAREIALAEGADVFLCELAAMLHDIGRVPEKYTPGNTKTHHELSYELLKEWFTEERAFDILSREQKIELLYALRYHWCDGANEYVSAVILRDADKLDMFGELGLERAKEWNEYDDARIETNIRLAFYCHYWLQTKTAQNKVKEKNLLRPQEEWFLQFLKKRIEPIEL